MANVVASITDEYDVNWNQKLGTGISGPVRVATKRSTGENFAIKVVLDRPKARQEVQMHWMCSGHPQVVSLFEVFRNELQFPGESESQCRLLLVLELMDGGELFYRISKQHGFTERHAAATTMQIALAVRHLHSMNIAHRDLKPENLLYKNSSEESPIKLCDFGFAKHDNGDLMTPQFTPYYVSPQVLEAQRRHRRDRTSVATSTPYTYDKSCDMWSLGVIIYILLCGYPPFYSEHPTSRRAIDRSMRRKIMSGTYQFADREWGRVSNRAKDVVKKLLCVDPHERMTIEELVQHPWLTEEAPDTLLQSPVYMSNKANMQETALLHDGHLKKMRIPDRPTNLKPIESAINPILCKRKEISRQGGIHFTAHEAPIVDHPSAKSLRDVIAKCMYPKREIDNPQAEVETAIQVAVKENSENKVLTQILEENSWNGDKFDTDVELMDLAHQFKTILESLSTTKLYMYAKE
ncbi:unnamed protein product [Clavelina lepadiformis]|uniref:Protein kinase domain-containing protein n=1 Tax=Clavelina lepadiformis TaxID=159417 RepID=A0ABP0FEK6_CLALP